jgi:hypothetical protein
MEEGAVVTDDPALAPSLQRMTCRGSPKKKPHVTHSRPQPPNPTPSLLLPDEVQLVMFWAMGLVLR